MTDAPQGLPAEFAAMLAQYDEALQRISQSHDALLAKVAELQAEIARKNDLLAHRERLAALGEIAASVAHEIRNPLGGIRLYLDLLEDDVPDAGRTVLSKIRKAVGRLDRVVHNVLTHSREIRPEPALHPAVNVVMEAVGLASQELYESDIHLRVGVEDFDMEVDADLLVRLLLNLILNAAQVMQDDGGCVEIYAMACDGIADLRVEDSGPGISDDSLDRMFTPFFSAKGGGTGLGLALCRRIAEAHGGSIEARNRKAGGACFRVRIPLRAEDATNPPAA